MNSPRTAQECPNCRQSGHLRALAGRLLRCEDCDFLVSGPRPAAATSPTESLPRLPNVAPGGLLRGKYRLIARLGEGTHGVSYLAEHEYLSHPCVVKILPQRVGESTDAAVKRLRNEARTGFRVQDPNVVRVLDCDVVKGIWYFVMEYVDGADLGQVLRCSQTLRWRQAVQVAGDAAQGLAAIHAAGLVHGDVKPSNLILGADGRVRVADLGVAGLAHDHDGGVGAQAPRSGTLVYTAPEVFQPTAAIGPRADLYSLGATLYHLMTGVLPHSGSSVFQRLIDLQCRPTEWPPDCAEGVPDWLRQLILELMAIEPQRRPPSTTALMERLAGPATVLPVRPVPVQPEALEPRGIGVLPFQNAGGVPGDDWLGYAVANHLSRALADLPQVYVADQDGLMEMAERLAAEEGELDEERRLREAGRMVGAGTVVTGSFIREGDRLTIRAEALRSGLTGARALGPVEGALADLPQLESALLERLVNALGLARASVERRKTAALDARERFTRGKQAFHRGDYEEAIKLAEQAVELDAEFLEAIGFAGVCLARLGRYDDAEAQHRKQEALAQRLGTPRWEAEALANLGVMNYFRGSYEAAEQHFARAAEVTERLGLATESAQICNNLGFVLFRLGRPREAERAFQRAIDTHRAYGGLTSLVGPYNGMGNVLAAEGRYGEARDYYRRALALATEIGDRTKGGTTHMHLGRCAAQEGHFAEAKHEFTMALNALEETRFWNGLARAYEYIAEMNLQLGDIDEAIRCADKRIELARQHSNVRMEAAAWMQKAESLKRAGREEEAAACLARGRGGQTDTPTAS